MRVQMLVESNLGQPSVANYFWPGKKLISSIAEKQFQKSWLVLPIL